MTERNHGFNPTNSARCFAFLCAAVPVAASYLATWMRRRNWAAQLISPAADLNIAATEAIVNGYCGVSCLTDLLFSDTAVILMLLLSLGGGVLAVQRLLHNRRIKPLRVFQAAATRCFVLLALLTLVTMLIFPSKGIRPLTTSLYALRQAGDLKIAGIILLQCAIVSLCTALLITMSSIAVPWFRQPYLVVGVPLVLYFLMHLLVGGAGYVLPNLRAALDVFLPDSPLLAAYSLFAGSGTIASVLLRVLCFPCFAAILCLLLHRKTTRA